MAIEYVNCETKTKLFLCMNTDCMCRNLLDKIASLTESKRVECAVYVFMREGLIKYDGKKIRNIGEEEIRKMTVI